MIYTQVLVDSLIMLLLCYGLAGQPLRLERNILQWFIVFHLLCIGLRADLGSGDDYISFVLNNYDLLPVDNPVMLLVLLLCLLILNSLWIRSLSNMKVVVVTLLSFLLWIVLRTYGIALTGLLLDSTADLYPYMHRLLTLLFAGLLYYVLIGKGASSFFDEFSGILTTLLLIQSSLAVLGIIIYANFDTSFVIENLLVILIVFTLVITINLWIIYEQNTRSRQHKRLSAIEQYLPVIDGLVSEVQARQHEFHNKLLAIHSIVETAATLPEAQSQIAAYTQDVTMQSGVAGILQIDSKVLGGFLYTKLRRAEQRGITFIPRIHTLIKPMRTEEHQLVEVIGVLVDNALEASGPGDEIILNIQRSSGAEGWVEISVMNPSRHRSNSEFTQMFAKGHTTKNQTTGPRGYGLYNMKQIVVRQQGKVMTRNTELHGIPYISIGVQIP
ncbi:sensor histidine kinase [Paenibacillus donghaensis]|uniref:Histidine kinase/HSP90-like ATPase domain-containing protein n=1 Tax=Paenibacillus donghaensis TaxID=414771 RepID=A0A2Z2KKS0_9BACL|nr:ATP-binding protein [Paenibacillus donghaensis]ASA23970.1 hypothetical protein B9T62_26220 [Paenibacillus donghaensis]